MRWVAGDPAARRPGGGIRWFFMHLAPPTTAEGAGTTLAEALPMLSRAAMSPTDPADAGDAVEAVCRAVLAYLARHPNAADSVSGVARWWVGDDGRFSLAQVQRALDRLVDGGRLRRQPLADGSWLYAAALRSPASPTPSPGPKPRRLH